MSEPELTPEQQAAYDKEVAWEEADRKRDEAVVAKYRTLCFLGITWWNWFH
jgi:hypothetical protein